jgi:hypothetical protein
MYFFLFLVQFYRQNKAAEANDKMLTDAFLKLEMIRAISKHIDFFLFPSLSASTSSELMKPSFLGVGNNTKIYFGPSVDSLYLDWMTQINKPLLAEAARKH